MTRRKLRPGALDIAARSIRGAMDGEPGKCGSSQRLAFALLGRDYDLDEVTAEVLDAMSMGHVRQILVGMGE